mmetsp:Transcript_4227/g.7760  ORF Transcript_4227/g.7760 Transcript_4227/m.7760 type:complete len:210 (-) Transcript_4227:107-736(-)
MVVRRLIFSRRSARPGESRGVRVFSSSKSKRSMVFFLLGRNAPLAGGSMISRILMRLRTTCPTPSPFFGKNVFLSRKSKRSIDLSSDKGFAGASITSKRVTHRFSLGLSMSFGRNVCASRRLSRSTTFSAFSWVTTSPGPSMTSKMLMHRRSSRPLLRSFGRKVRLSRRSKRSTLSLVFFCSSKSVPSTMMGTFSSKLTGTDTCCMVSV